MEERVTIITA